MKPVREKFLFYDLNSSQVLKWHIVKHVQISSIFYFSEIACSWLLVTEIGRKLNIRSCPKMHFIRRVSIRHPMTSTTFNEIFGSLATKQARKKGAFETTRSELDRIFPNGWAERSFKTSTKCTVSPKEPVRISFKTECRIDYNHSACPRCRWDGVASKPQQCNPKRVYVAAGSYVSISFTRQRTKQPQKRQGKPGQFFLSVDIHVFYFYKNKLYKNTQDEFYPKIKNETYHTHQAEI